MTLILNDVKWCYILSQKSVIFPCTVMKCQLNSLNDRRGLTETLRDMEVPHNSNVGKIMQEIIFKEIMKCFLRES